MYRGNCIDNDAEDNFDAAADDDDDNDESLQEISLSLSLLESFYPSGPPTDFTQVHGQLHVSSIDIRWMGKARHFGVEG